MSFTPELVDSSASDTGVAFEAGQYYGPIHRSGDIFITIPMYIPGGSNISAGRIGVFKSTDTGATWAEVDAANHPSDVRHGTESVFYPGSGSVLYFGYSIRATEAANLNTFDMSTGLWGAAIPGGPSPINRLAHPFRTGLRNFLLSTGAIRIIYEKLSGGKSQVYWAEYSGGVWSNVDTQISTNTSGNGHAGRLLTALLDPNDVIHVWFDEETAGVPVYYANLAGTTISAIQTVFNTPGTQTEPTVMGRPIYFASTDSVKVPFRERTDAVDRFKRQVSVLTGSPSSAPVFTKEVVGPAYDNNVDRAKQFPFLVADSTEAQLYCWYGITNGIGSGLLVYQSQAGGVGAWSARTTYYDEGVNPPVPFLTFLSTTIFSVTMLADTPVFSVVVGMDNIVNGDEFCDISYYLFTVSASETLSFEIILDMINSTPPGATALYPEYIKRRNAPGNA